MKETNPKDLKPIYDTSKNWNFSEDYAFSDLAVQTTGRQLKSTKIDGPYKPKFHILQYVTHGKGTLEFENETFSVQAGDLFYLPQDMLCRYYGDPEDPYEYYWVSFSGNQAGYLLSACGLSHANPILHIDTSGIDKIFFNMYAALFTNNISSHLYAVSELIKLFSVLIAPNGETPSKQKHFIVEKALSLFDESPTEINSIEEMCSQMGINSSHFSKIFKEQMNISPKLYLNRKKIAHAKKLLSETDMPIKAIAMECGFSENAFIRTFSKLTDRTPLAYRKHKQRKIAEIKDT